MIIEKMTTQNKKIKKLRPNIVLAIIQKGLIIILFIRLDVNFNYTRPKLFFWHRKYEKELKFLKWAFVSREVRTRISSFKKITITTVHSIYAA